MATATPYEPGKKAHQFEIAGLGPAPYRLLGVEQRIYRAHPDAPIQPGTTCDYCGTGIMYAYMLSAADGRIFKVGCDCVLKTDSDKALRVAVKTAKQQHEAELRTARQEVKRLENVARVNAAVAQLPVVADTFRSQPHPNAATNAYFNDKTRLDWAEWMLANAGLSGRLTVAKAIESTLTAQKE